MNRERIPCRAFWRRVRLAMVRQGQARLAGVPDSPVCLAGRGNSAAVNYRRMKREDKKNKKRRKIFNRAFIDSNSTLSLTYDRGLKPAVTWSSDRQYRCGVESVADSIERPITNSKL